MDAHDDVDPLDDATMDRILSPSVGETFALDRIAAVFRCKVEATNLEAILNGMNSIRAILRETGRQV